MSQRKKAGRPPFDCVALLLQGGGALGAFQAGAYQALAEADLHPDWVAGISIGAINAALIAGNPPEIRADRLRCFWEAITPLQPWDLALGAGAEMRDDTARSLINQMSAAGAMMAGVSGFFAPRFPTPWLSPPGSADATSYYDTAQLKTTLEQFVDFDRINSGEMRFSVGAVNVRSGNFVYFDSTKDRITSDHILASGALPPGFPAISIDGEDYWDGGLVSNTPLQWVLQYGPRRDTLAFQIDLWSARGELPDSMAAVATRQKEITYSSRTRDNTDRFRTEQTLRHAIADLLEKLPPDLAASPESVLLKAYGDRKVYGIVELIYRTPLYEGDSKDYEFSRASMQEHWRAGYQDMGRTLRHPKALARPTNKEGIVTFDIDHHEPSAPRRRA